MGLLGQTPPCRRAFCEEEEKEEEGLNQRYSWQPQPQQVQKKLFQQLEGLHPRAWTVQGVAPRRARAPERGAQEEAAENERDAQGAALKDLQPLLGLRVKRHPCASVNPPAELPGAQPPVRKEQHWGHRHLRGGLAPPFQGSPQSLAGHPGYRGSRQPTQGRACERPLAASSEDPAPDAEHHGPWFVAGFAEFLRRQKLFWKLQVHSLPATAAGTGSASGTARLAVQKVQRQVRPPSPSKYPNAQECAQRAARAGITLQH